MKQSAVALIFNQAKTEIVLLKRRDVPVWVLPGGGVETGETPAEAASREASEETGLTVAIVKHIATYTPINRLSLKTSVYECTPLSGSLRRGSETREIAFFPINSLPTPFFTIHRDWLQDALENQPNLIEKPLSQITYSALLRYTLRHPIHVARLILSRLGLPINHRD